MASLGELFIQLAFEGDTKGAEEFQKSLKKTESTANKMISVMKDLTKTVQKLVEVELSKLSETTDNATVSTENNTQTVEENTQSVDENTQSTVENTQATQENTEAKQENTNSANENNEATQENTKATQKNTEAKKKNSNEENKNEKAKKDNSETVKKGIKVLRNYALAISGAIYALHRMTDALLKQNQEWLNLTRTSDIALDTFQKWDSVGKTLGVNNAADQIKNLNDRLFELKLTGQGAKGFMLAGINPTNAEDVMEQLRNRIKGMDDTSASYILKQMGLDPNMLHILRMSREEFEGINAELKKYRITAEQRKQMQFFNYQIQIAAQKLEYLKQKVISAILPAWTKFMHSLARVTEGVVKFVGGLKSALDTCPPLVKGILGIATAIGVLKTALWALSKHPIIAWLGILYLLIDDIVGYFQGKKSLIGGFQHALGKFNELPLNDFIKRLEEVLNHPVPEWMKTLLELIKKYSGTKEDEITAEEAMRGGLTKEEYEQLKKAGDKKRKERLEQEAAEQAKRAAEADAFYRTIQQNYSYSNNNQNKTINYNPHITVNTNEPIQNINSLLPFSQAVFAPQSF